MQFNSFKYCDEILIIQFNISVLFAQLNDFKHRKWLNISISAKYVTLTDATRSG